MPIYERPEDAQPNQPKAPSVDQQSDEAVCPPAPADQVHADTEGTRPLVPVSSPALGDTQPLSALEKDEADLNADSLEFTADDFAQGDALTTAAQTHPHRLMQGLSAAALRDVGRVRQNNQDSVLSLLMTLPREQADIPFGLFVVADGMGGHEGGEVASRLTIRTVVYEVLAHLVLPTLDDQLDDSLQVIMLNAVQAANRTVWEHAQDIGSDMGTTCSAALLLGNGLYMAHVGDSRIYLQDSDGLHVLTDDHSTVGRLIQMGQITAEEARDHPLRNQLYRSVGHQEHVEVDFVYQPLGSGTHLLVCSDGLWGLLSEAQIEAALRHNRWPQDACSQLIDLANEAGGEDNIAAVVVSLPVVAEQAAP